MIKLFRFIKPNGEILVCELARPEENGIAITEVTGLGSPPADVILSQLVGSSRARFNAAPTRPRDITITYKAYQSHPSDQVRALTYQFFAVTTFLRIQIEDVDENQPTVETAGYVNSNVPTIFSDATGGVIDIRCIDSYFYDVSEDTVTFYGEEPLFEFPFEYQLELEPYMEFSLLSVDRVKHVMYEGQAPTSIRMTMIADGDVADINVYNETNGQKLTINTSRFPDGGMVAQDRLIIDSDPDATSVTLLRGGEYHNVINSLGRGADWLVLQPGLNVFVYDAEIGFDNLQVWIEYANAYEGV